MEVIFDGLGCRPWWRQGILANARYVYIAAYDGDQFNPNLLSEDRDAIGAVQEAIHNWGELTVVYRPSEADFVILVTSRPSEDVLAVYQAQQGASGNFLWRVMGRDGLQSGETRWSRNLKKDSRACKGTSKP